MLKHWHDIGWAVSILGKIAVPSLTDISPGSQLFSKWHAVLPGWRWQQWNCQLQYRECKFSILSSPITINMGMKDKTCYKPLTLSSSGDCSILNYSNQTATGTSNEVSGSLIGLSGLKYLNCCNTSHVCIVTRLQTGLRPTQHPIQSVMGVLCLGRG